MCHDVEWPIFFNETNLSWVSMLVRGVRGACTSLLWPLRLLRRLVWLSKQKKCLMLAVFGSLTSDKAGSRRLWKLSADPKLCTPILHRGLTITCCVILSNHLSSVLPFPGPWYGHHRHYIFGLWFFCKTGALTVLRVWIVKASYLGLNIESIYPLPMYPYICISGYLMLFSSLLVLKHFVFCDTRFS